MITRHSTRNTLLAVLALCCGALPTQAQPADLGSLSLEELMKIEITSASRKQQSVASIPAAVHVITADDIRRSGLTTLPDLLRLAPGVQVARINANKWAVSIRGFNELYATKLLVLVDGRPVYNRFFSGVLWDADDVAPESIERIEIMRGPGAAMWGTNAVNGVINIVTRAATGEAATTASVSGGTFDRGRASVRHGGTAGAVRYVVHTRVSARGESRLNGAPAGDDAAAWQTGGRLEGDLTAGSYLVAGHVGGGWNTPLYLRPSFILEPEVVAGQSDIRDGLALGRFTRQLGRLALLQVQSSAEFARRTEPMGSYRHNAGDVDVQVRMPVGAHDLVVGGTYRLLEETYNGVKSLVLEPARSTESVSSVFLQDDVRLGPRVTASVAGRLEKATEQAWELQPTIRLLWTPASGHYLWGAASRAVRAPSLQERHIRLEFEAADLGEALPVGATLYGNHDLLPERMSTLEAGYRLSRIRFEFDAAGFYSKYSDVRTVEWAAVPELAFTAAGPILHIPATYGNLARVETRGVEVWSRFHVTRGWRLDGGVSLFSARTTFDAASTDLRLSPDTGAPRVQATLRSLLTAGPWDVDLFLRHVARTESWNVDPYNQADARVERRLSDRLSLVLSGQNLLGATFEGASLNDLQLPTESPRRGSLGLRWRIR